MYPLPSEVISTEVDDHTIAEALYIINKVAKRARNEKNAAYDISDYENTYIQKTKEQCMYCIKDATLKKLEDEEKIITVGYHTNEETLQTLKLLKIDGVEGFSYHVPCNYEEVPDDMDERIIDTIPSIIKRDDITISEDEAVAILMAYTGLTYDDIDTYRDNRPVIDRRDAHHSADYDLMDEYYYDDEIEDSWNHESDETHVF